MAIESVLVFLAGNVTDCNILSNVRPLVCLGLPIDMIENSSSGNLSGAEGSPYVGRSWSTSISRVFIIVKFSGNVMLLWLPVLDSGLNERMSGSVLDCSSGHCDTIKWYVKNQ